MDAFQRTNWNFFSGQQFTFGPGAYETLEHIIRRKRAARVLLICDPVLEDIGTLQRIRTTVERTNVLYETFRDPHQPTTTNLVDDAAAIAVEFEPDLVVGVGGGSTIDLAKCATAVATCDLEAEHLFGRNRIPSPIAPLACLPTTSGVGSEVSHTAVLRDVADQRRHWVVSQYLRPEFAIVDPYLAMSCPSSVTALSGAIALSNAVEATLTANFYTLADSPEGISFEGNNPLGDLFSLKAVELIGRHLVQAVQDSESLAARSGMALASAFAGMAAANCGGGFCRAVQEAIHNAYPNVPDGAVALIVLPEVVRHVAAFRPGHVAKLGSLLASTDVAIPEDEAAEFCIQQLTSLRQAIELPGALGDFGVAEDALPGLAMEATSLMWTTELTPGETTVRDTLQLLQRCF